MPSRGDLRACRAACVPGPAWMAGFRCGGSRAGRWFDLVRAWVPGDGVRAALDHDQAGVLDPVPAVRPAGLVQRRTMVRVAVDDQERARRSWAGRRGSRWSRVPMQVTDGGGRRGDARGFQSGLPGLVADQGAAQRCRCCRSCSRNPFIQAGGVGPGGHGRTPSKQGLRHPRRGFVGCLQQATGGSGWRRARPWPPAPTR